MSERIFLNPQDGELYPESWYHRENIDLACVIEAFETGGGIVFDIWPDNLERMNFQSVAVISLIAEFAMNLTRRAMESDDPEEAEECAATASYVSKVMMKKLKKDLTEH